MKRYWVIIVSAILIFSFTCRGANADSFPTVDKIRADLIGKQVCHWQFDSIAEFRKLDVIDKLASDEIVEYDLHIEVEAGNDDRAIKARAIYKRFQGEWILAIFKPLECREPMEEARKIILNPYEIVVSRMDEINESGRKLHITIFLLNKSEQTQVYPDISISLKTKNGSTALRRKVTPKEYVSSEGFIRANKLGKVLIEFNQPPADAVGFEASVLRSEDKKERIDSGADLPSNGLPLQGVFEKEGEITKYRPAKVIEKEQKAVEDAQNNTSSIVSIDPAESNSYLAIVGATNIEVYLEPDPFAEILGSISPKREISITTTKEEDWVTTAYSGKIGYVYADQLTIKGSSVESGLFIQLGYFSGDAISLCRYKKNLEAKGVENLIVHMIYGSNGIKARRLVLGSFQRPEDIEAVKEQLLQKDIEHFAIMLTASESLFAHQFDCKKIMDTYTDKAMATGKAKEKKKAEAKKKSDAKRRANTKKKSGDKFSRTEGEAGAAMGMAVGAIQSAVVSSWIQPQTSTKGLSVSIRVNVSPHGVVTSARVIKSSGNALFDRSAEIAILKASPLPIPSNPRYYPYIKEFDFRFSPNG